MNDNDLQHLRRCVALAAEAVEAGDEPFGSVLVAGDGTVLAEDRNRERSTGDPTRHPEIELARWAAANLTAEQRAAATVYTSGEHCAMCSAAHGWVGLGRIVYATAGAQLRAWSAQLGSPAPRWRRSPSTTSSQACSSRDRCRSSPNRFTRSCARTPRHDQDYAPGGMFWLSRNRLSGS